MKQQLINTPLLQVIKFRRQALQNDSPELQEQRQKFVNFLMQKFHIPTKTRIYKGKYGNNVCLVENSAVEFCEMYPQENSEPLKSKWDFLDVRFNRFWNTRKKLPSETLCEIDTLPFDDAIKLLCEICLSLMRKRIHFAVFYAIGQRSPHIRIYDFNELAELNPFQREQAQREFWKQVAPFLQDKFIDQSIFTDEHPVALEFAPHWKYGTPFNLLFEYVPEPQIIKIESPLKEKIKSINYEILIKQIKEKNIQRAQENICPLCKQKGRRSTLYLSANNILRCTSNSINEKCPYFRETKIKKKEVPQCKLSI